MHFGGWGELSGSLHQSFIPAPGVLKPLSSVSTAVSMKSPIFGPAEVSSVEGSLVSIKCYYPATSVNRHTRKYWCRQGSTGSCNTLISSEGYISKEYLGRANLTNLPAEGAFVVNISQLSGDDSGHYKCGLGINNRGLSFDVNLEVSHGKALGAVGFWGKLEGVTSGAMGGPEEGLLRGRGSWPGVGKHLPPKADFP